MDVMVITVGQLGLEQEQNWNQQELNPGAQTRTRTNSQQERAEAHGRMEQIEYRMRV